MNQFDDEFGARLADALQDGSRQVPVLTDLAGSARKRRKERHRNRAIAGAVAGAVVLAGFAVALPHLSGSPKGSGSPAAPSSTGPTTPPKNFQGRGWIPDGWRSESYDGIEMAVPDSWKYGDLGESCTLPDDNPVYDRPGGISGLVGCTGPQGYGVRFEEPRKVDPDHTYPAPHGLDGSKPVREFPENSAVRTTIVGDTMVLLVLKDAALADQVIGTVHAIGDIDANGCTPTVDVPALGTPITSPDDGGALSVCRYSLGSHLYLEQSELLSAQDSASARTALTDAPTGTGPDASLKHCTDTPGDNSGEIVELRTATGPIAWVHFANCRGHGTDLGRGTRELTKDVMYWALSPGWAGVIDVSGVVDRLRDARVN